ncbi:response regulator [Paenibacillus aceti]|uniref:DNA-binding response regulator n=1 Tax=Paenibacillus aceti TaxID=1820010 RepID=A0ABQ1VXY1_9BACL|nr:response regulator [Paenibacillus aceti]GGG04714.1 hypothetical protein GCM10010913_28200 [Paenibacillus aceti]
MYRVLIVDDDRLARKGIISMLPWEKYGMVVAGEAQNGAKALEFLQNHPVDLLFVDIDMPVMGGISLMEKCHLLYPHLLFIVLTFHEEFHYAQSALRIGAIDYISKLEMESTDCDELLHRISQKVESILKLPTAGAHTAEEGHPSGDADNRDNSDHPDNQQAPEQFNMKEWEYLVGKWNQMYWLYDDTTFRELCKGTRALNISVWRAAQVLLHLTSVAEESIGTVQKSVQEYSDLDEFIDWIVSFREALYRQAAAESSLDNIQLCILKAVIYIKQNLGGKLHGEEVARIVKLSRSYFSISFKKYTGMSFNEFVREERIRRAQILLVKRDDLVADIAQEIGYEDVNYFIRVFCEITGMTPGEYRKHHGGRQKLMRA